MSNWFMIWPGSKGGGAALNDRRHISGPGPHDIHRFGIAAMCAAHACPFCVSANGAMQQRRHPGRRPPQDPIS
ncbi:hypothetical protein SPOA0350 (plasmid) [Ruegeria pomeroyi DSS-3]|uniref:Uncharacterized protein n=1 Tax=Ruegeria pomeroyi (strain ATCC 700808 / DSM 15171 / DSS-3) TaxID=246200 RepID=Q5LKN1_RUEPO|nr:hypothetical protein SPOA0350 [Ruegeria pomeroyi DSS-3]HCE71842.1 hypothetical protein [Ruegeria sp.]